MFLKQLVSQIFGSKKYSDFIIESGAQVMLKLPDRWVSATEEMGIDYIPSWNDVSEFIDEFVQGWESTINTGAINRSFVVDNHRFRANIYLANAGTTLKINARKIPEDPIPLSNLGLPSSVRLLLENRSGIILISGATGSGKTTTMASIVDEINRTNSNHIVTIEDPIEYVFKGKKSIFSQREVGIDCESFYRGVLDALRQRPDVIVIGEIRDKDTAEQALIAGESGHLVIGTIHAYTAVSTIGKLLGFFPANERESKIQSLSFSLIGILNQVLLANNKSDSEYILAVEFLSNHKRQNSNFINDPIRLQQVLDRSEDGVSISAANILMKLIQSGVVDKAEAAKKFAGNAYVYEKIRNA